MQEVQQQDLSGFWILTLQLPIQFVDSFKKKTKWTYLREMYQMSAPTTTRGVFQISASIDKVKLFLYLQLNKANVAEANPYLFDTIMLMMMLVFSQLVV